MINTGIGIFLGVDAVYGSWSYFIFLWGFFLAGFICGMAVLGIITVLKLMHHYAKNKHLNLDYRAPDTCGGLQFIGNSILKFSIVIILTGVLIASYILFAPWSHEGFLQGLVKNFWILFPFIMAVSITFSPIHDFSKVLIAFKSKKDIELATQIKNLEEEKNDHNTKEIQEKIESINEQRKLVFKMNTLPLNNTSNFLMLFGNVTSLVPGGLKVYDFLKEL